MDQAAKVITETACLCRAVNRVAACVQGMPVQTPVRQKHHHAHLKDIRNVWLVRRWLAEGLEVFNNAPGCLLCINQVSPDDTLRPPFDPPCHIHPRDDLLSFRVMDTSQFVGYDPTS